MYALSQEVLRTDVSGMPLEWIDYRDAVRLHFMGQVAYSASKAGSALKGGVMPLGRPARRPRQPEPYQFRA